jgi:hypothetical protein
MPYTQAQQEGKYVTTRIKEVVKVLKGQVDE